MKKLVTSIIVALAAVVFATAPEIRIVTVKQRYPWNGLIDITCNVTGIDGVANGLKFTVAAVKLDSGEVREVSQFWVVKNGVKLTDNRVRTNGTYRLLWDSRSDLGPGLHSNMVVRVTCVDDKVRLWEDGPYWATTNIGAENPEDYGYYFWWGDTVGYKRENDAWVATDGSSENFSFDMSNTPTYDKSIATLQNEGWITADGALTPSHDAAHVHWGGDWRMPTKQELDDLNSNCDWVWTTQNGVKGYIVHGRGDYASNSIFLPCVGIGDGTSLNYASSRGDYWASVPCSDNYYTAWGLYFHTSTLFTPSGHSAGSHNRRLGTSVRPVQGFAK